MANPALLAPAAALALWSLVVLLWMMAARVPLFRLLGRRGTPMAKVPRGARGSDLEAMTPGSKAHWLAHNYTHLMEQPTLFYALAIVLALAGGGSVDAALAWAYVGLRVVHSLWQGLVNSVPVRAGIFVLYTLVLVALAVRAVLLTLGA